MARIHVITNAATGETTSVQFTADEENAANAAEAVAAIPTSVTMRQARLALLGAGLLPTVNNAIAAMPGVEGEAARIDWEFAGTVERNSPLVTGLSASLSLSAAQLDALFTAAAGL